MDSYEREVWIAAPLEDVWAFHSSTDGLETLTPAWMDLRVEAAIGPEGERDPTVLESGSEIDLSMRPFGRGPRQHWRSLITARERTDGVAYFRDEMVDGPFDHWLHTHTFYADGEQTLLRDRVEYALPFGALGGTLGPFARPGFEAMFRARHAATKAALEGDDGTSRSRPVEPGRLE
ncbi:SRPBCC family protein [Natronobiforma cellulositropha]|uniref:SRPBCC family protein n=1 Tax=Natronobiforma cellulositropha TaxID=1679076 RepID=UPI0021D5FE96|nr:SRPBCC family protein [Natronobiforma cellulositropha]